MRDLVRLAKWSRSLAEAAQHAEHPWNGNLMIESLILEGERALEPREKLSRSPAGA